MKYIFQQGSLTLISQNVWVSQWKYAKFQTPLNLKLIEFDLIIEDQVKQDIVFFHLYFSRTEYYSKGNLAELYLYWNESTIAFISARELYISSYLSRHLKCLGKQEKSL